jgi:replication-associated recombination protein RarA
METLFASESQQSSMPFPKSLTEVYKPLNLDSPEWCGLEKQRKILKNLAANPRPNIAILLEGAPGVGKTSLSYAFARTIGAEVFHIGSQEANLATLQEAARRCTYVPLSGGHHCLIIDEIDRASSAFQLACLSKFDGTEPLNAITIMTCNDSSGLDPRFLSRCIRVPKCNCYGASESVRELLRRIWRERAGNVPEPDFSKTPTSNVRESLNWLECELLSV